MSRTDDLLRELEEDAESSPSATSSTSEAGPSRRERLGGRLKRVFSLRYFVVALALALGGLFLVGTFLPFVPAVGLLGVFLATFGLGLVSARRHYTEVAVAGAVAATASVLADFFVFAVIGDSGATLAAAGAGAGALVAVLGHYFGRDLRAGLTEDL
ncbi:hypothetical protein [Halomarina ordinaria]|uniref:DUF456 domain-containing protein n=1 Tax=Halomarina ordinaria TaxID=3033939 RepID=A0ABD5U884_9EURY|nr:hypothetical protein [Halomarina sp. PSRA2]